MNLEPPSDQTRFFNFLDSHDGIGLLGVKNILPKNQIDFIIEKAKDHDGKYLTGPEKTGAQSLAKSTLLGSVR